VDRTAEHTGRDERAVDARRDPGNESRDGGDGVDGNHEERGDEGEDDARDEQFGTEFDEAVAPPGETEREDDRPGDPPDARVDARDRR